MTIYNDSFRAWLVKMGAPHLTPCKLVDQLVLVQLGHQLPVALHQNQSYQALSPHGCPQESFEALQLAKATLPFSARHREHRQTLQDPIDIRVGILPAHEEGLAHVRIVFLQYTTDAGPDVSHFDGILVIWILGDRKYKDFA